MNTVRVGFASRRRISDASVMGSPLHPTPYRAIVGIKLEGKQALNLPDPERWGDDPRIDVRRLPLDLATRLETFIDTHYIKGVPNFNCFTFMRYVSGLYPDIHDYYYPVRYTFGYAEDVVPLRPYVMFRTGEMTHGFICFTTTRVCMSVIGNNRPLTWTPFNDLMASYDAESVQEVLDATPM